VSEVDGGVDKRCEEEEVTPEEMRKRDPVSRQSKAEEAEDEGT